MTRTYLIGMPGSGKSAVGKRLAEMLRVGFVDLDEEIEKIAGMAISRIFEDFGESHFRKIESDTLLSWASRPYAFVMATGGGAPCFHAGIEVINRSGISIFLDVPPNELASRISAEAHRPLIGDQKRDETLAELLEKRRAIYERAKLRVDARMPPDDVARAIMELLESYSDG